VIIKDDRFDTNSVTICPFTKDLTDAPLFRLNIEATPFNGLQESCRLMVDRMTTVSRSELGAQVGALDGADLVRLNRAIVVFLGIASAS
jgi:mRNA interferase MazF